MYPFEVYCLFWNCFEFVLEQKIFFCLEQLRSMKNKITEFLSICVKSLLCTQKPTHQKKRSTLKWEHSSLLLRASVPMTFYSCCMNVLVRLVLIVCLEHFKIKSPWKDGSFIMGRPIAASPNAHMYFFPLAFVSRDHESLPLLFTH